MNALAAMLVLFAATSSQAFATEGLIEKMAKEAAASFSARSHRVEPEGAYEVAFSPNAGSEKLVIKVIDSARRSLRVAAYSFTSKPIAEALLHAHKRGVDVQVVLDKSQAGERYSSATFLANVGIPVRIDTQHAIQHNKFTVADSEVVETGSFNYTSSATTRNAENVLVIWGNPKLAAIYQSEWERHWSHALAYQPRY